MSVRVSQTQLTDAYKLLRQRWERVRERWDDPNSRALQRDLIDPLEGAVRSAVNALDGVAELITAAARDCANDE